MSKLSRQKTILELLDEGPIASQEELQKLLHRRGLDAGQATLSRDIRELGLVKSAGGYSLPGREVAAETDLPSVGRLVREFVTSVRAAQNLLVTKPTAFRECSRNVLQTQSRSARRYRLFRPGVDADSSAPSARG